MKWLDRLNKCLDYIEDNLNGEIEIDELLSIACLSRTHFNRMFDAVTDLTITAYIRNRRMTKAVFDLQQGNKVIDVAMNYGYSSSESFSRAFKSFHNKIHSFRFALGTNSNENYTCLSVCYN